MFGFGKKKVRIGLALGGGGARGFSHLGVIKAFEEFGIKFDYVAGTSVGSLMGAFYADGFTYQKMYEIAKSVRMRDIKKNIVPFVPSKIDGVGDLIKKHIGDKKIEELKTPFSAIAVDLISTNQIVFSKGDLAKAVMSSCAVPAIFHPVSYDGMLLADGGLQNTIPSDVLRHYGCDYVVAVDVNKSRGQGAKSTKLTEIVMCSIRILMKSNATSGYVNADVVIGPETKRFKSTKPDGMEEMIEEGYNAAIDMMPQIMALFKKKKKVKFHKELENVVFKD